MVITLNDDSMLEIWRLAAGFEPSLSEASIERFDSLDIDTTLRRQMRAWYLDLIATGDLGYLRVDDITDRVRISPGGRTGEWRITLPVDTGRVVDIEIEGQGAVTITPEAKTQISDNRYIRCGGRSKAVLSADRREIRIYGTKQPTVNRLRAVTIPEDDVYILDERALGLIDKRIAEIH